MGLLLLLSGASLNSLQAGELAGMETVYLVPNPFIGLSFNEYYENLNDGAYMWTQDWRLRLNVAPRIELQMQLPVNEVHYKTGRSTDRLGDVVVGLNYASRAWKEFLLLNYTFGFNFGSAPAFRKADAHPMEGYGHEEIRLGVVAMKNIKKVSLLADIRYHFRAKNEEEDLLRGFNINIFTAEAWRRWFGFNPGNSQNFFYSGRLKNDNIVWKLGVAQYYTYPFTTFLYFEFRNDFLSEEDLLKEKKRAPGVLSYPLWLNAGAKWLTNEETLNWQISARIALNGDAHQYSDWGVGLGVATEF